MSQPESQKPRTLPVYNTQPLEVSPPPHNRSELTLPIASGDDEALRDHMRAIALTVNMWPYCVRIDQDCLQVKSNEDGSLYVSIEIPVSSFVAAPGSPEWPLWFNHEKSPVLHISVGYSFVYTTWSQKHRSVIKSRALLAGCPSGGVFVQFTTWGNMSPHFLIRPETECYELLRMIREIYLAEGLVDGVSGFSDFHISWRLGRLGR